MKEGEEVKDEKSQDSIVKKRIRGRAGSKSGTREREGKGRVGDELHVILCMEVMGQSKMTQIGLVGSKAN
jgi:hypothetical protein